MKNIKTTIVLREDQYQLIRKLIPQLMIQTESTWNFSQVIRTILDSGSFTVDSLATFGTLNIVYTPNRGANNGV